MKYLIAIPVQDVAGKYVEEVRSQIAERYPNSIPPMDPHITLKAPFTVDDINEVESILQKLSQNFNCTHADITGINNFHSSVIYAELKTTRSFKEMRAQLYGRLLDLGLSFSPYDLPKQYVPHVTIAYAKGKFSELMKVINSARIRVPITKLQLLVHNMKWVVVKEFELQGADRFKTV